MASSGEQTANDARMSEYLEQNPEFLQRNPEALDYLNIPHASGSAVSLVEKQVGIMRERNIDMRRRLNTLTANARDNDQLYEQSRQLILRLVEATSVAELYRAFMHAMREDFKVEHASMIIFGDGDQSDDNCRIDSADSAKNEIGALLKGRKAICGTLRKEELSYLFPKADSVGSAAVMPLNNSRELGIIAVGSSDPHHYDGNMGTLFLNHIAEVMVRLLPRLQTDQG